MRRALLLALTASILVLSGSVAGPAQAAPREFYGTVAFNDPTSTEFERMGTGKIGTFRTNFYWAAVSPLGPGSYDWSRYDQIIGDAATNGIRVLPTIYGSPPWAASDSRYPPDAAHRSDFADFLTAAVQRYGSNGTFWIENPLIPKLPIIDWQLWNEVNSPSFWLPKPKASQYKTLLQVSEPAIHAGDPDARIVLAGLFRSPRIKHGIPMVKYLKSLYAAGAKPYFDAVAVHPYAATPAQALRVVQQARSIMKKHGDRKTSLWITELGWASSGKNSIYRVGPKKQAAYLSKTFKEFGKIRKRDHIAGVIWFCLRDRNLNTWVYRTGLFNKSFKPKPAWRALVHLTHGSVH